MPVITLTTDFGTGSRYVAQLKGVLLSRAPTATLIDFDHDIPPQDIIAASRLIEQSAPWHPHGSIHLAVVDPGVGADRAILAIEYGGHRFLGPDNGLFGWLADDAKAIVALDPAQFSPEAASPTFHGRDLMAPAAARLANGDSLADIGVPHEGLVQLPGTPQPTLSQGLIEGVIVEVDRYGNLITNIRPGLLGDAPFDERLRIECGVHKTFGLQVTYGVQEPQTLIALVGSTGYIELAIVCGDAAAMLVAGVGDSVTLTWES